MAQHKKRHTKKKRKRDKIKQEDKKGCKIKIKTLWRGK
jgi:hypothetical protein